MPRQALNDLMEWCALNPGRVIGEPRMAYDTWLAGYVRILKEVQSVLGGQQ